MAFLNTPLKAIQVTINSIMGIESMPWYNPSAFPLAPGSPMPTPIQKDFRWRVIMNVDTQSHSSYISRKPGSYNGQDIAVGQWIANLTTGQAWQIITIESKSTSSVTAIVQDIYRYNTFRDVSGSGNGSPNSGMYVVFGVGDTGSPEIDPVPSSGTSSTFTQNLMSRFEYINLQYDYPLYQEGNTFSVNDVISASSDINGFVLADGNNVMVIGRVTSVSDTIPGWFTINPVQKIVDYLNYLPGNVGDILYSSASSPGEITTTPGGAELYIKLRNNTSSKTTSMLSGPTVPGNVFQINGENITVTGSGSANDVVIAVNLASGSTGVSAATGLADSVAQTNISLISSTYGEPALFASSSPATATINGVSVTFNITSTEPGYEDYARVAQMATAINNANIPNIVASAPSSLVLKLTNTSGGAITIINGTPDINGVLFAGTNSGSGLPLTTSASTNYLIEFTAIDARPINFLNVSGTVTDDFGLISVENGTKAAGLYIEQGLRNASSTVVSNLGQMNALSPLIGDTAYVIDSNDGQGNSVGEWSMWLYNGSMWIQTANQDSSSTDAHSLEYTVNTTSPTNITIGEISTGTRITLITVEVITPFNAAATLSIGYDVNHPSTPVSVLNGLMDSAVIDLSVAGTYTTSTDVLFGTDTPQGDITVTASFNNNGSVAGEAQIIVSYV